jgi:hypothetical protein
MGNNCVPVIVPSPAKPTPSHTRVQHAAFTKRTCSADHPRPNAAPVRILQQPTARPILQEPNALLILQSHPSHKGP